jgi:hypothetical protein
MNRKDTDEASGTCEKRQRLNGTHLLSPHDFKEGFLLKNRIGRHVVNQHALSTLKSRATGCEILMYRSEAFQKPWTKAFLSDDPQCAGVFIQYLQNPELSLRFPDSPSEYFAQGILVRKFTPDAIAIELFNAISFAGTDDLVGGPSVSLCSGSEGFKI